jgi:hypothetical protein
MRRSIPFLLWAGCALQAQHVALVKQYCAGCHNSNLKTAGLTLDTASAENVERNTETWETVVRRLRARQMPPAGLPRPDEKTYHNVIASLESTLDAAAAAAPHPGRTDTFRRLTRTEYKNAIRDLLALDVDVSSLLPADDPGHGFDNVTVGDLSPTLLDRYITAAERISRLAIGAAPRSPGGDTFRVPPDLTQEEHTEGLPLGTRGGTLIPYTFPLDAEYELQVRLTRDRNEHVEGLRQPHELELLIDGQPVQRFIVTPPATASDHAKADLHLKARIAVKAGPHQIGVTFLKSATTVIETFRQPYLARFNMHRHPRQQPAIFSVSITGPYNIKGPGDTPSRRRILSCKPSSAGNEEACAKRILSSLAGRAWRGPAAEEGVAKLMRFWQEGRNRAGFEAGIESALSAILVSPQFLIRVEQDPPGLAPGSAYRISDRELASRLSFFLWSSIPDEELLDQAIRGELKSPAVLEQQVRRMLADPRAKSLVSNFAGQWLHLRRLDSFTPDLRLFPDFDDNLRQSMRRETEMLFETMLDEDRSVLELITADYTFLNERLAKHYGIPHIYGSRLRRVALSPAMHRGGILTHGSILAVTSYPTRTSAVIRGKWVLDNLLGIPPPPPPAAVPDLKENTVIGKHLTVRERLAEHRNNPACSGCHQLMDPVGFALENYDSVGAWRNMEEGKPIDASGGLPDGRSFQGVAGLRQALVSRPEIFAGVVVEKLLTYALGRGVEHYDAPAVRQVLRRAREDNYRLSSLIVGVVRSTSFQMRRSK